MSPKSLFLFKKNVYLKVAAFLLIIPTILVLTFTQNQPVADAQIASLYASTCLGGWKDVDKVTGIPEVARDPSVAYSERNSATLYNKQTQIYCGGFKGVIPDGVNRTRVALRFSWGVAGEVTESPKEADTNPEIISESPIQDQSVASSTDSTSEIAPSEENVDEAPVVEEPQVDEAPPEEPAPVEESVSWLRYIIPQALAQEELIQEPVVQEVVEQPEPELIDALPEASGEELIVDLATTSPDQENDNNLEENKEQVTATTTSSTTTASTTLSYVSPIFDQNTDEDNAIFEVLFTMDNEAWFTLGYVSRINNDIQFELPLELFTSVDDFSKLQISLKTVERFDDTPKIYLDSMWLEVSYLDAGEDPLPPPGTRDGDIIMTSISTPEATLVTVFRGVGLETVSNILTTQASSTATTTASSSELQNTTAASSTSSSTTLTDNSQIATSSASSTTPVVLFESDIPYEVRKNLRATPGVEVELWLYERVTDSWARVADNTIIATVPRAVLFDNKIFWFGTDNATLWRFDVAAKSYSSRSLSPSEPIEIEFINASGEAQVMYFNHELEQLEARYGTSSVLNQ